ncbi:hypothetical protein [uncultured Mediterranean phage uvMED]|nr:hypothetical protein [uncultured Mediterranean phage uvMED]
MPSDLQITNIRDQANANSAITIASDGQVSITQNNPTITLGSNATGFAGIKEADQWRITANNAEANSTVIQSNLERVDTYSEKIGTGMTVSSGIWTFPSTGKYEVSCVFQFISNASGSHAYGGINIDFTTDNSSYTTATEHFVSVADTAHYSCGPSSYIFDITNVATHKVRFRKRVSNTNFIMMADTNANVTYFTFKRLGDT